SGKSARNSARRFVSRAWPAATRLVLRLLPPARPFAVSQNRAKSGSFHIRTDAGWSESRHGEPGGRHQMREVQQFYETLPFNFDGSIDEQAESVRQRNQIAVYEPLHRVLQEGRPVRVLDLGSGAGWFANSVARWYGLPAIGVDFCSRA